MIFFSLLVGLGTYDWMAVAGRCIPINLFAKNHVALHFLGTVFLDPRLVACDKVGYLNIANAMGSFDDQRAWSGAQNDASSTFADDAHINWAS